ncbi:NAD(P)-dependent oxidoreductase [Spirulina sp. CS-785/01]|uniref:NAD(P)-dependent oxidoreductase n=1 Tax=Spirulina sp. CS-785/01 TaxID=3021716 RepID=UPI00232B0EDF|nr:NAD(P)-dependent oxidoreductase [Spirulina sp. CS-785/01]MDB9314308.1 NAD(P)-dependent oxidoreductase [Spirulina sp. CS-785/01]
MSQSLAFLGLGVMGGSMAANLAKAGKTVSGWNRTPNRPGSQIAAEAGVNVVPTLQEAVQSADIIFTCVGDVPDVEEVLLGEQGIVQYAQPNALIVDTSTIGSEAAKKIGAALVQKNFRFLDAPISGGDVGAKNGTLTFMVGGEAPDFAQCQPYFEIMGKNIRHCGPVGSGQAVKMCNQILCSLNLVGICEAMLLAEKQGIDPNLIVEVCSTGAAGSWALSNLGMKVAESDYDPGFMIKHMVKDLRLVKEIAENARQKLPGTDFATELFKTVQLLDAQADEQGTQAMIRAYRETGLGEQ